MLLCVQFPLADARWFLDDGTERLAVPQWPSPTPNYEFVRYFGAIRYRPLGGLGGWLVEDPICKADRAISLLKSPSFIEDKNQARIAFRRLYFVDQVVGKFEIGFHLRSEKSVVKLKDLERNLLRLPVQVRNHKGTPIKTELAQAGKYLAQLYLIASRSTKRIVSEEDNWRVRSGTPLVYLEINYEDNLLLPPGVKPVQLPDWAKDARLFHYGIPYRGGKIYMWIFKRGTSLQAENLARSLRLVLLRLQAEQECLRLMLQNLSNQHIQVEPRSPLSEDVQSYLYQAVKRIMRDEKKTSQVNEEIIQLARQSMNVIRPGQLDLLLENASDYRMHLQKRVENFAANDAKTVNITYVEVQKMTNIEGNQYNLSNFQAGILNIESTLTDVNQSVGNIPGLDQSARDELKHLVDQLNLALQKAPADSVDDAAKVAKTTKRLVEDISEEKPDKDIVQITLDGLKKAAENIAKVLPDVLPIALQIAQFATKFVGLA